MRTDDWCICGPDEDEDSVDEESEEEDEKENEDNSVQEFNDNLNEAVYGDE